MTALVWDDTSERTYQYGVDHAVLYPEVGIGVIWGGMQSIELSSNAKATSAYWDSRKRFDLVDLGMASGTIRALDRPQEFLPHEGVQSLRSGVTLRDQKRPAFGLSWRTKVDADEYKLHMLHGAIAVPKDLDHNTMTDKGEPTEFEWAFSSAPNELVDHRPAAHIMLDSRFVDAGIMTLVESYLYGTVEWDAWLPPIQMVVDLINNW